MDKRGRYLGYAVIIGALPMVQWLAPLLLGRQPELPYLLMLLAALLACGAALTGLRRPSYERRGLLCLALALGCWSVAVAYAMAGSATDDNLISTYLIFLSYGLPLLYVVVTTTDEPATLARRIVDGALFVLLVTLAYLGVRDLADAQGVLKVENTPWIALAFDLENVFLLVIFLLRYLTASGETEHRFFRLMTIFLGLYAVCAGLFNHSELYPNAPGLQRLVEVLPSVPFMVLICLLHAGRLPRDAAPNQPVWARQLSVSLTPGLLLIAIFALALPVLRQPGFFGRAVLLLAVIAYLVRITQTQYWFTLTRDQLAAALRDVERVSLLDELTGIPNRRAFDLALAQRARDAQRQEQPLSALMIDVDYFKVFNDTHGHPQGDVALRAVARLLSGTLRRPTDFIARYGGEEFVALLPGTDLAGAQVVARRMNRAIYEAQLEHRQGIDGRVTVSIGIASARQPAGLVNRADQALYTAKHAGRNRFMAAAAIDHGAAVQG